MGIVNISLNKGIHRSPSIGEQGELSECVNLIPRGGELVNVRPPKKLDVSLTPNDRLLAIHHVSGADKYIYTSAGHKGLWCLGEPTAITADLEGIKSVTPMGNTLIINTDSGLHYALWAEEDDVRMSYKFLGQKPPELNLSFSLEGTNVALRNEYTGAKKYLWMKYMDGNDAFLVTGENEYNISNGSTEWYTYVFKKVSGASGYEGKPESDSLWPKGWSDTPPPVSKGRCYCCRGKVVKSNNVIRVVEWGTPFYIWDKNTFGTQWMYWFAESTHADTAPSSSDYKKGYPDVATEEASVHEAWIGDKETGIDKSSLDLLTDGDAPDILLSEEARGEFTNAILGKIEQWHQQALADNKFCYPFFVRYAYRLYNGDHFMASAPILMIPNSQGKPWVAVKEYTGEGEYYNKAKFYVVGPQTSLLMRMNSTTLDAWRESIKDWKDIIKGVDVFVSKEFKGYDASGVIKRILSVHTDKFYSDAYTESFLSNHSNLGLEGHSRINICDPRAMYGMGVYTDYSINSSINLITGYNHPKTVVELPDYGDTPYSDASLEQSYKAFENRLISNNLFYKIKEFNLFADENEPLFSSDDIQRMEVAGNVIEIASKQIDIDSGAMEALESREVLSDNYNDHSVMLANFMLPYNARLNLAGVRVKAYDGYNLLGNAPVLERDRRDTAYKVGTSADTNNSRWMYVEKVFVYLKTEEGKTIVVEKDAFDAEMPTYFYYPDPRAYKAVFKVDDTTVHKNLEVKLTPHPTLYGAYWFRGFFVEKQMTEVTSLPAVTENPILRYTNQIWASPTRDPFRFPPSGRSTVGLGEILAINTSAKAMSSGTEHGKFPLYAFCTDGIWPLAVADDGRYGAPNPAVRDVCYNTDSICQIDGALLYASEAGLRLLQGEDAVTLSDMMKGESVRELFFSSHISDESLIVDDANSVVDMLMQSRIVRDFANNIVHVYPKNPSANGTESKWKHYVLDLETKEWASVVDENSKVVSIVPGFPRYTLQLHTGELVQFTAEEDNDTLRNGILLTRPIAFGEPFAMKMLADLRMLYSRHGDSRCGISVYVSNDRVLWRRLSSLHAHSYKWYRFRIQTQLYDTDALTGIAVDVSTRRTNKLR